MIYFVSSGKSPTGGPTLMHQGCYELTRAGFEASMLYMDIDNLSKVHEKHASLNLNALIGLDSVKNQDIIIVPEQFDLIQRVARLNCRKIIWWLSVDNFIVSYNFHGALGKLKKARAMLKEGKIKDLDYISHSSWKVERIMTWINSHFEYHWVQSHYAHDFLSSYSIEALYVGDYLTKEFFEVELKGFSKENMVLFNPRKGVRFMSLLKDANPDIKFVPIENLSPQGVQRLLMSAKVYVDFGNHPGQDRIPREAALCGCSILVGLRGSAKNDYDVPIPARFKVNMEKFDPREVGSLIKTMVSEYEIYNTEFDQYREYIKNQPHKFKSDIISAVKKL